MTDSTDAKDDTQKYSLEEQVVVDEETLRKIGKVDVTLGNYNIKTKKICESISSGYYYLKGVITVSKIITTKKLRKKYVLFGDKVEVPQIEIKQLAEINLRCGTDTQLYQPHKIATLLRDEMVNRGIKINPEKARILLDDALKPYIDIAKYYCEETKKYRYV
jgi:hypothetical protein